MGNIPTQAREDVRRSQTYHRQFDALKENFKEVESEAVVIPPAILSALIKLEVREELNRRNFISRDELIKKMKAFQTQHSKQVSSMKLSHQQEIRSLRGLLRKEQRKNSHLISTLSKEVSRINNGPKHRRHRKHGSEKRKSSCHRRIKVIQSRPKSASSITIPSLIFEDRMDCKSPLIFRSPNSNPSKKKKNRQQQLLQDPSISNKRKNKEVKLPKVNLKELLRNMIYTRDFVGAGRFGKVFRVEYNGEIVCAKIVTHTSERELRRELRLNLSVSPHPNIIRILAYSPRHISGSRFLGFVMENFVRGSIGGIIMKTTQDQIRLDWNEIVRISHQTALGMQHLHRHNITHYSLHWNNVLMTESKEIRITDFGSCRRIPSHSDSINSRSAKMNTFMFHLAPEVYEGYPPDKKCDVYAFGMMLFELLVCTLNPYKVRWSLGNVDRRKVELRAASDANFRPTLEDFSRFERKSHHEEYIGLMKKCWSHQKEMRPSFDQIVDVLEMLLVQKESDDDEEEVEGEQEK